MDKILLFIPMYNCEKQITRVLGQIDQEIGEFISEIIIVNNRSTDNGEQAVADYLRENELPVPCRLLRNRDNYNLGGSHKVAFAYAMQHGMDYVICLHGDDQGSIRDLLPVLRDGSYRDHDCVLGARFMPGSKLQGYSKLRILGNYGFDMLFSLVCGRMIYDLGSGLNMFKVESLRSGYYKRFPDSLYFNDCMVLALCHYCQDILFYPITWREDDQVSNNKMIRFSLALLRMLGGFCLDRTGYITSELRDVPRTAYGADVVISNEKECTK